MSALEAESTSDPNAPTAVELAGVTVHVLPVRKWKASAIRAMREGDFDIWAEKCLADGNYAVWQDVDPTMDEVEAFFADWTDASGQSTGKSSASRPSSRSTARH